MFSIETALWATLGGLLIGGASAMLMILNGRIAGISGIVEGVLSPSANRGQLGWKAAFVAGLVLAGAAMFVLHPSSFPTEIPRSTGALIVAGLLVGFGTRLGSGCTSGHGVCGMSRLSPRSIIATLTFMLTGAITVGIITQFFGGTL